MKSIVNFLFETGMLSKTPRSGFPFLGSGKQSVAEHTNRACFIAFSLSNLIDGADVSKAVILVLFHDLTEARVSDLNYVHQKYNERKLDLALEDLTKNLFFGGMIKETVDEFEDQKTLESHIAKDADNLELLLAIKEQIDVGNKKALSWFKPVSKRLITDEAKKLAQQILHTEFDEWWFEDKEDIHWVKGK